MGDFEEYRLYTSWLKWPQYTQSSVCNRCIVNVKTFVIYATVVLMYSGTDCLRKKKDFRLLMSTMCTPIGMLLPRLWQFIVHSGKKKKHVNMKMSNVEVMRTNNNLRNNYNCHLSFVIHLYPQQ